jgi:hypothetical protein
MTVIEPLQRRHRHAVEDIFWSTFVLGDPFPFPLARRDEFVDLCLGWYFEHALKTSSIITDNGAVVGYLLVCCDPLDHRRWVNKGSRALARAVTTDLLTGRLNQANRSFYWSRVGDAAMLYRAQKTHPSEAHAHVNLVRGYRDGTVTRRLREVIDERCRDAGHASWIGEINAKEGRRAASLERVSGDIVGRTPNRTMSLLAGSPVVRLTMRREVPPVRVLAASA